MISIAAILLHAYQNEKCIMSKSDRKLLIWFLLFLVLAILPWFI